MKRIYLDACCVNRPFDDQRQQRIRLETDAIEFIFRLIQEGKADLITSSVLIDEILQTSDLEKQKRMLMLCEYGKEKIVLNQEIIERGECLAGRGLSAYDALHVACAEVGAVDIVMTTDDRFMKKMHKFENDIKIKVKNPLSWIKEEW